MTDPTWKAKRDLAAEAYCKDWPREFYEPSDIAMFFKSGYDQGREDCLEEMRAKWAYGSGPGTLCGDGDV